MEAKGEKMIKNAGPIYNIRRALLRCNRVESGGWNATNPLFLHTDHNYYHTDYALSDI